jgi:NAD(P)-dependent dehydrogenase (short-subunit alcohol dehydrogenase family)
MAMSKKRVLITGASRGFGRACVEAFLDDGWDVVATARAAGPTDPSGATWVQWDVTDDDTTSLTSALGGQPLDVLVNNAGRGTPGTPLDAVDVHTLLDVCDVNVGGVVRSVQAVVANLRAAPAPIIFNISSRLGSVHDQATGRYAEFSTSYAYRISKAAQNMTTTCLANELAPGIRVWAVHPGVLGTSMGRANAAGEPSVAAKRLVSLAADPDPTSPRFRDLDGEDLPW